MTINAPNCLAREIAALADDARQVGTCSKYGALRAGEGNIGLNCEFGLQGNVSRGFSHPQVERPREALNAAHGWLRRETGTKTRRSNAPSSQLFDAPEIRSTNDNNLVWASRISFIREALEV